MVGRERSEGRARVLHCLGLGLCRIPDGRVSVRAVADDEAPAHAGHGGDLGLITVGELAVVAGAQGRIDAGGCRRGCLGRGPDLGASPQQLRRPRAVD